MEDTTVIPGNLLVYSDFTDEEFENFIFYLGTVYENTRIMYLRELATQDNLLRFLDVMQNEKISIPPREVLMEFALKTKLYTECKRFRFDESRYKDIGKRYNKSINYIKRTIAEMHKILEE